MFKSKLEEEIIRLKELCIHIDIVDEKLRRGPVFLLCGIIKKDEPPLNTYPDSTAMLY